MRLQEALLAEEIEIRMPTLWRYEAGTVLGMNKPKTAMGLMSALLAYEFDEVPLSTECALDVLAHMRGVPGVTFYDSAYHVLALRSNGVYLTADLTYLKRAERKGRIGLLDEWQGP